jgi:hypothetical protein
MTFNQAVQALFHFIFTSLFYRVLHNNETKKIRLFVNVNNHRIFFKIIFSYQFFLLLLFFFQLAVTFFSMLPILLSRYEIIFFRSPLRNGN